MIQSAPQPDPPPGNVLPEPRARGPLLIKPAGTFLFYLSMPLNVLRPQVSHFAEVGRGPVHLPGLQVGVSRAPETQVRQGAFLAGLQEFLSLRTQVPDGRDEVVPGLNQGSGTQIVGRARCPERRAEAKPAVIADAEAAVSRPAMDQVVTPVVGELLVDEGVAVLFQGTESGFIPLSPGPRPAPASGARRGFPHCGSRFRQSAGEAAGRTGSSPWSVPGRKRRWPPVHVDWTEWPWP